jgi:hypothetical protein
MLSEAANMAGTFWEVAPSVLEKLLHFSINRFQFDVGSKFGLECIILLDSTLAIFLHLLYLAFSYRSRCGL